MPQSCNIASIGGRILGGGGKGQIILKQSLGIIANERKAGEDGYIPQGNRHWDKLKYEGDHTT